MMVTVLSPACHLAWPGRAATVCRQARGRARPGVPSQPECQCRSATVTRAGDSDRR